MNQRKDAPIGVFDSGVGGLTVAREIMRNLPHERIVYFGDTASPRQPEAAARTAAGEGAGPDAEPRHAEIGRASCRERVFRAV